MKKSFTKAESLIQEEYKSKVPVEILPEKLQNIIKHYSSISKYPIDYFFSAVISACSSAIGRSYILKTGNYTVNASLWLVIVGQPGLNKTAPLNHAYEYLIEKQRTVLEENKKHRKINPDKETKTIHSSILSDTTPEAVMVSLANNPRGVTIFMDEIAGFVASFNRYHSGADEQMYLSLFNGSSIIRNRLNAEDTITINTFLTIVGTTQPSILNKYFSSKAESGFFDRWLLCYPEHIKKKYPSDERIDKAIENQYKSIIETLCCLNADGLVTTELSYSQEAFDIINHWQKQAIDRQNNTENDVERAILSKFEIYVHRFALILHIIEISCSDHKNNSEAVGIKSAKGAVQMANYFYSMVEKVRVKEPSELLQGYWKSVYDVLPNLGETFTTSHFISITNSMEIPIATAKRWLRKNSDKNEPLLFVKISHGIYSVL
ncbi:DUF3987 domain-containing protein [Pedobacter lithocola]|uniref:DUF3987 domain-containing protein n=1 Tax=Pedobacter lithocola TaxID=1908239 RepID=A0ABV8PA70_9SPHI